MGGVVVNDDEDGGVVDVVVTAVVADGGDGEGSGGWWSLKVVAVVSGGRVWGRWGDEAAEERLVAGVWVAGGWPERVATPDFGGGRRKPNGRRGRDDLDVSGKTEKLSGMSFYVKRWYTP
ncbi:hypothetical protein Tco_1460710 [Tanacetum coccineum]